MTKPAKTPPLAFDDLFSASPEGSNPRITENPAPAPRRTLWDIATPEEVAHSILIFYADPMRELRRRKKFARRQKAPEENIRFWAEVGEHIRLSAPHPGRTP